MDQIVAKLHNADMEIRKGKTGSEIGQLLETTEQTEVTEQTYYRWRQNYGGMRLEIAKQLRALEKESTRLKRMAAEQALDEETRKEAAKGNW